MQADGSVMMEAGRRDAGRMLRIAIFHGTLPTSAGKKGGVEASVHRLASSLCRRGKVDVTVFTYTNAPQEARYKVRRIFSSLFATSRILRILIGPLLLNFVDFSGYDLIHFHGDDWFFLKRTSVTVRTFHGSALKEARSAPRVARRVLMYFVYLLEVISSRLSRNTIAVGEETKNIYKTNAVIGNGVDRSVFCPRRKTAFPSVAFVGTWGGRKRGEFLFKIFLEYVLPVFPDAILHMIVDKCPPHRSVQHHANASDAIVANVVGSSWVFAYPSTYEGFGIPYIEALACGTAILTSPNPGASDVLANGRYGLIAPDDRFSTSLVELLRDAKLRNLLVCDGTSYVKSFDEDVVAEQHEALYEAALHVRC